MNDTSAIPASTTLSIRVLAECPFSAVPEYAIDFLTKIKNAEARAKRRLRVPFQPYHDTLWHASEMDELEPGRRHEKIRMRWERAPWPFATFEGAIRSRIHYHQTQLLIEVSYAQRGHVGRLAQRTGKRLVYRWLQRFAADLTAHVRQTHNTWRTAYPDTHGPATYNFVRGVWAPADTSPSTPITWPVIQSASNSANTAARAMSSGSPMRPSG